MLWIEADGGHFEDDFQYQNLLTTLVRLYLLVRLVVCTFIPTFWTFQKRILDTKHTGKAMSTTFEIICKKNSCSPCISSTSIQSNIPTTFKYKNSNHPICFYLRKEIRIKIKYSFSFSKHDLPKIIKIDSSSRECRYWTNHIPKRKFLNWGKIKEHAILNLSFVLLWFGKLEELKNSSFFASLTDFFNENFYMGFDWNRGPCLKVLGLPMLIVKLNENPLIHMLVPCFIKSIFFIFHIEADLMYQKMYGFNYKHNTGWINFLGCIGWKESFTCM